MSKCQETQMNGNPSVCYPAGWSTGLQGQCRRPYQGTEWSVGQNSFFQNRCMGEEKHFLTGKLTAESVDIHNASRMRPYTFIPVAPQNLEQGSNKLQLPGSASMKRTSMSSLVPHKDHNNLQNMTMPFPPSNFAPSSYCDDGYKNCMYSHGLPYVGVAKDGCLHNNESCSQVLTLGGVPQKVLSEHVSNSLKNPCS